MNLKRIVRYDLFYDAGKKYAFCLLGLVIALTHHMDLLNQFMRLKQEEGLRGMGSWMDYWIYLMQGKEPYVFSLENVYDFPTSWFLLFVSLMIPICIYTWNDMQGFGKQVMIKAGGKRIWLLSKYIWALAVPLIYEASMALVTVLYCASQRISISARPTWYMMEEFCSAGVADLSNASLFCLFFVMPYLLMVFVCWLTITLLTFLGPSVAFLVSSVVLIVSIYHRSYCLPANWGMPVRIDTMTQGGLRMGVCLMLFGISLVILVVIGINRMQRKDLFD